LIYLCRNIVISFGQLVELVLQSDGGVVGTEHLGRESRHETAQVLVENRRVQTIKEVVALLLVLHEELQVLEDAFLDLDEVVVSDGILTQEVELNDVFLA
jgi:hypothetical protein